MRPLPFSRHSQALKAQLRKLPRWIASLFARKDTAPRRTLLAVEAMEDRTLPSGALPTPVVTTYVDGMDVFPSLVSDQEFALSAGLSGYTAPTGSVDITIASTDLGTETLSTTGSDTSAAAAFSVALKPGSYTVTVTYYGDINFSGTSVSSYITVNSSLVKSQTSSGTSIGTTSSQGSSSPTLSAADGEAANSNGGPIVATTGAGGPAVSDASIYYEDGGAAIEQDDLSTSSGYGLPYSETWTYSNIPGNQDPNSVAGSGGTGFAQ